METLSQGGLERERERPGAINMLVGTEAAGINEIIREKT